MSKFTIILLAIFGFFILAGVLIFSLTRGSSSVTASAAVWGTVPSSSFNQFIQASGLANNKTLSISYVEKDPSTIESDFTEALAEGRGPDLVILSEDQLWKNKNKLAVIPYSSVTQADFEKTFAQEGDILLGSTGAYGLPLYIDPLVLYSNKTVLSSAGVANPIGYWDEVYDAAQKLTVKDAAGNITRSAVALGGTSNIPHAKDILALLMLQAGTPITRLTSSGLQSELASNEGLSTVPGTAATDFYTQFSNPEKVFYTWNRSLLPAATNFASGDSAYYVGFASEYPLLLAKNPDLSLGVSSVPQSRISGKVETLGRLYSVAVSKGSANQAGALTVALSLVSSASEGALSSALGLPPARRDLLSVKQNDPAEAVFFTSAIQAAGWLDPDQKKSAAIFSNLIDSVTSGRSGSAEAVQTADKQMSDLITSTQ